MSALADSARALLDPVDGTKSFVDSRRIATPLLVLMAATAFGAAIFALRWDAAPSVIRDLAMSGELQRNTEQEIADKITMAWRTKLVGGLAGALFMVPIVTLVFAAILKFAAWLFGLSLPYVRALSVAVLAMLPKAIFHIGYGLAALRQTTVSDKMAKALLPSNLAALFPNEVGPLAKVYAAVDFFSIWGVLLLGMGFCAATGMRKSRSLLLAVVLFALYVGVFEIGLPALGGGQGGPPGGARGGPG